MSERVRTIEVHVDPAYVARRKAGRAVWAKRLGTPQRCKTNIVHPSLGCCLFCGADSGEACKGASPCP